LSFPLNQPTVTIAINTSLSGATYIGDGDLVGIMMPAGWTSAGITFQSSYDGVTYQNLWDAAGNEITVSSSSAVASQNITIDSDQFDGCVWIKFRSGTGASPVNQAAARTITLLVRKRPQYITR